MVVVTSINECRGILFHGAPGTGKTLVARALAGACSHSQGGSAVTLFARKGADCLGKFAGEAERTLRLLFDEVCPCEPTTGSKRRVNHERVNTPCL